MVSADSPADCLVSDLRLAARRQFVAHSSAGARHEYGAVGSFDYVIECDQLVAFRESKPRFERTELFTLADALDVLETEAAPRCVAGSVGGGRRLPGALLDLGTGDGKTLKMLHENRGYEWSQIVGVTAEDMRGVVLLQNETPFDVRDCGCPDASYIVMDLMDLVLGPSSNGGPVDEEDRRDRSERHSMDEEGLPQGNITTSSAPAGEQPRHSLSGRKFSFVFSWVTFCWLVDPLGVLCAVFNELLEGGGVMLVGGVQLLTLDLAPEEEQRWLFAWSRYVETECRIRCRAMADGVYTWLTLRKSGGGEKLELAPALDYANGANGTNGRGAKFVDNKVGYRIDQSLLRMYFDALPRNLPRCCRRGVLDGSPLQDSGRELLDEYPVHLGRAEEARRFLLS